MKVFNAIVKVAVALAAVAGAVYVVATYGEQIVAWAKRLWTRLESCKCCGGCEECDCEDCDCAEEAEPAAEEVPAAEEAPAEQEVPAEEAAPADEAAVIAEDTDFEG